MEIALFGGLPLVMVALFGGFAVLVVFLIVRAQRLARERREGFAALAHARGWQYAPRDDTWTTRFSGAPFGQGHNRQAHNVLVGQWQGRGFVSMDYVYYTTETSTDADGHTSSREVSHSFGVVALNTGASFPALSVTPEGAFGRLLGRLTDSDIELESEDFNRAFTVRCPNRRFASDLLHPQMMELLLREPNFAFRFDGPSIMAIRDGQTPIPEVEVRLSLLDAIVDLIPDFVWQNVKGS